MEKVLLFPQPKNGDRFCRERNYNIKALDTKCPVCNNKLSEDEKWLELSHVLNTRKFCTVCGIYNTFIH